MTVRLVRCAAVFAACIGAGALAAQPADGGVALAEGGKSVAAIYVRDDEPPEVQAVADELAGILKQMSGADLGVVKLPASGVVPAGKPAVVLGSLAEQIGLKMERTSRGRDGYRYRAASGAVLIVGESPQGVCNGVYALLESLGCGWYAPGAVGEVVPSLASVAVADGTDRREVSDSIHRRFWYGGKNRAGEATDSWLRRNKAALYLGSWRHAWGGLVAAKKHFQDHPEYFSLNRGARTTRQLCTTNPDTIRIAAETLIAQMAAGKDVVYPAGPNDGGGLCECTNCTRLGTPDYIEPTSGLPDCTDRIFQFASDVAALTAVKFPDRDLGILVYSDYSRIPRKLTSLHANVFPMFAPIRRCRLHGPGTPLCPLGLLWQEEIAGWAKLTRKLGFYIYNYNLADSLVPLSKIGFYKRLAGEVAKADIQQLAWVFETIDSWSAHAPHLYLSARLSWNSRLDVDAEMDRYFCGFYAEAAEPMRNYWLRIDRAYEQAPTHTGSQYGLHHVWTAALLAACRADIEQAQRLARSDRVRQAVAMAEAGLRCAELFMQVWDAVGAFDFAAAGKAQAQLKDHVHAMAEKTDPSWAHERYAWGYYAAFVARTVSGGEKVLADGGRIVARLPDVWRFARDDQAVGAERGWFRPDYDDSKWGELATFSKSWSDQALGTYRGDGWYRASFTVPASAAGADLRLWFGGFDENVDVYLNGQHLGEKKGFARPAEFEAVAQHVKFGAANVLAVRVSAGGLAEIGTGGIMMPVMIYAARPAADQPPADRSGSDR